MTGCGLEQHQVIHKFRCKNLAELHCNYFNCYVRAYSRNESKV